MANTITFDMDGTIYDLYKIPNWLPRLCEEDATVFQENVPRNDFYRIDNAIEALAQHDWTICVITWAPMNVKYTDLFFHEVNRAKMDWLQQYMPNLWRYCQFACIPYGESKSDFLRDMLDDASDVNILVDDNKTVRAEWREKGKNWKTINASRNFVRELEGLVY